MTSKVTLEQLLEAGAHFGHQARRWNPKMQEYLYGVQDGVHIFDLAKTREVLEEALEALRKASSEGKVILFIGTKKQAQDKVKEVATEAGISYMTDRWLGGTITNFGQILVSIKMLTDLKSKVVSGEFKSYTKKERLLIDRKIEKLEKIFGGMSTLTHLPDMLLVIDTHREIGAVKEAWAKGIPVVGVVDSNADPSMVTYPVPMNDDASKALDFVIELFGQAIMEGKKKQPKKKEKKEKVKK